MCLSLEEKRALRASKFFNWTNTEDNLRHDCSTISSSLTLKQEADCALLHTDFVRQQIRNKALPSLCLSVFTLNSRPNMSLCGTLTLHYNKKETDSESSRMWSDQSCCCMMILYHLLSHLCYYLQHQLNIEHLYCTFSFNYTEIGQLLLFVLYATQHTDLSGLKIQHHARFSDFAESWRSSIWIICHFMELQQGASQR